MKNSNKYFANLLVCLCLVLAATMATNADVFGTLWNKSETQNTGLTNEDVNAVLTAHTSGWVTGGMTVGPLVFSILQEKGCVEGSVVAATTLAALQKNAKCYCVRFGHLLKIFFEPQDGGNFDFLKLAKFSVWFMRAGAGPDSSWMLDKIDTD